MLLHQNCPLYTIFDAKKGAITISSYPAFFSTGCFDKLSTVFFFFPLRRKGLLDHTDDNEMFALAVLTLYENLLIAQIKGPLSALRGVRIKYVKFRENVRAFHKDKENCP